MRGSALPCSRIRRSSTWNSASSRRRRARTGPAGRRRAGSPDSSSRNRSPVVGQRALDDAAVVGAVAAATSPWRSTRATKPVDAVELRSKTSAIRPIGWGPSRRSRNSSRIWPRVRSRAGTAGPGRGCRERCRAGRWRRRSAEVGASSEGRSRRMAGRDRRDTFSHTRIVRAGVKYRQARTVCPQQGLPALPRWSGVIACSHSTFDTSRSWLSTSSTTLPVSATARTDGADRRCRARPADPRRAGRPRRSGTPARRRRRSAERPPARRRAARGRARR